MTHGPISCTKFLVRVSRTRNLDRLPSALHSAAELHAVTIIQQLNIYDGESTATNININADISPVPPAIFHAYDKPRLIHQKPL